MKVGTKKIWTLTTGLLILMCVFAVCIAVSVFAQPTQFLSSAELSQFFDTDTPANPYPSISGIHNGTITPKVTIHNVSKLYTYPCPGTGGHTEHVAFYDSTTDALITEGYWNGYTDDDRHSISFYAFTMYAGNTYKFSIRTGSYPQIIHNQTFKNDYGTINCTEFVDANGRSHNNWIPALRLSGNFVLAETGYCNPKTAFTSHYNPVNITVNPCVPPYQLPLNETEITNFETITSEFVLSQQESELLKTNGSVILDYGNETDIVAPYKDMKARDIPIFVTADTLLHLYHIQFNEILKGIEEREFFDALVDMSDAMLERSKTDYETFDDPAMKEAARRNVAYFSVALTLLQTPTEGYDEEAEKKAIEEWNKENSGDTKTFVPIKKVDFSTPDYVKSDVNKEIENIGDHQGFLPSYIFNSDPNRDCEDECCYCEDYSQYVPRGHYTRSEMLKRYFKAMMWYGRMAFLLKGGNVSECGGGETPLLTEEDAKIATIQASLISSELPAVEVGNATTQELWTRMYSVTAFFVGTADDLTPYDYQNAIGEVFADFDVTALADDENLLNLKAELAKLPSPEIYGGSGVCAIYTSVTREKLQECLAKTKGLRFMGQRFIPDSYMFQQLVSPAVGMYAGTNCEDAFTCCYTELGPARCFPRGLDVMAVLGSERAEAILREEGDTEYAGKNTSYQQQLDSLEHEFDQFNVSDWNRNLYWSWLYTLQPLLKDYPAGYPTFMQTEAWQNKGLQTALASWTELRHDTILYAKQSYTPPLRFAPPQVVGYVEPVPEFYARLLSLTNMTENGLEDLDALNETERARLQNLEGILERLINISVTELENNKLSEADYEFIRNFGENLDSTIEGVSKEGKETTIVADVHTDCNTEKVLEEGVGYVKLVLVAYNVPDGDIIVGAGPVFSYYEFKQPMNDRLTDEAWKEMLQNNPPEEPEWVKGFKA